MAKSHGFVFFAFFLILLFSFLPPQPTTAHVLGRGRGRGHVHGFPHRPPYHRPHPLPHPFPHLPPHHRPQTQPQTLKDCHFDKIFQLGDSISDTGNLIMKNPNFCPAAFPPYGETYFNTPTGRFSDGRLIIDFIAKAAGLDFINPYMNKAAYFGQGVNFAVAGSTALATQPLAAMNIFNPVTNSSLDVQLDWMNEYFSAICHSNRECSEMNKHALFMVGEIGGNDYNYAFLGNKTIEEVIKLAPNVVHAIEDAVKRVIEHYGAVHVVVPGNFPIGCLPIYLSLNPNNSSEAYDEFGCLKDLNGFARYHNELLQRSIEKLREKYPRTAIVYGDYYNASLELLREPHKNGFDERSLHKACCGVGGKYNFDMAKTCGFPNIPVCPDPSKFLSWDGVHLTEKAYKNIADQIVRDIADQLHCGA